MRFFTFYLLFLIVNTQVFAQFTPDPGLPGKYGVARDTFDLGDIAFKPPSFPEPVELRGSVHYPSPFPDGPSPVVFLMHGRHVTIYNTAAPGAVSGHWPPWPGYASITSFDGYDYFAKTLASHGYIVISISANGINAFDGGVADAGMNARAELIQKHLDLWNDYNTIGGAPFGAKFIGKLDMQNVGTMGHSRGGEGVIYHALLNRSLGSPYGIKAVLTLAPVNFFRKVLNDIPLMNIAPYCDGDVNGLDGVYFYDDARYNDITDNAPKYSVLLLGANHNFFNTVWTPGSYKAGGTLDDWVAFRSPTDYWCGKYSTSGRLDTSEQKAALNAYGTAFFRTHLGGETAFLPILEVEDVHPPASSLLDSAQVFVSHHAPYMKRKDLNRTDRLSNLSINTLSAPVHSVGMMSSSICGGGLTMPSCGITGSKVQEPHRGLPSVVGLSNAALRWNSKFAYYENEVPFSEMDASGYKNISFRIAINIAQTTPPRSLNFKVQLVDSFGKVSNQKVSSFSNAVYFPPGNSGGVPKVMFNTIKLPLDSFRGIKHTKIEAVRFLFNESDSGSIVVSDIAFSDINKYPCGLIDARFKDSILRSYEIQFYDSSKIAAGDSIIYKWSFDDVASGVYNSSSLKNPFHKFTRTGLFKVCLKLSIYRENGVFCQDSFCKNITVAIPAGINNDEFSGLSISPNPAKNFVIINGALPEDVFELKNLCGQTVLKTKIDQAQVNIPAFLPAGVYILIIHSQERNVVQKLLIER